MIDAANEDEVDGGASGGNKTNLSNLFTLKKSIEADYFSYKGAAKGGDNLKRGIGNTKKGVKAARGSNYLIPGAKKVFNHLRHAFTQAPILQHFNPQRQIRIKTDASGYAIGGVLSQLTLNDLGQWHLVAYYFHKIISAKTQHKTHNGKLLAILEVFKIWRHYLEDCNQKILIFIYQNNCC